MQNKTTFRVQLVYKGTDDVHYIFLDNASLDDAKQKFETISSGKEVDAQIIDTETGQIIESK